MSDRSTVYKQTRPNVRATVRYNLCWSQKFKRSANLRACEMLLQEVVWSSAL